MNPTTPNRKTILLITTLVLIVIGIGYFVGLSISRSGKMAIPVRSVPGDAQITLNEKKIGTGTAYITEGSYTLKVEKEGFATIELKNFAINKEAFLDITMDPVSPEAKKWAEENNKLYLAAEGRAGEYSAEQGRLFRLKNPISALLPYNQTVYKIGYTTDESKNINLTIHATTAAYRQAALKQISDWGYDPSDYHIEYIGFDNPLE